MGTADQNECYNKPSCRQRLEDLTEQRSAAVEADPANPEAIHALAAVLACQRRFDEALEVLAPFIPEDELGPPELELLYGRILHLKRERHGAAVHLYRATRTFSDDFRALYLCGLNQLASGDDRRAAFSFKFATDVRPESEAAHAALGRTFWQQGRRTRAITCFRKVGNAGRWWPDVTQAVERADAPRRPPRPPRDPRPVRPPRAEGSATASVKELPAHARDASSEEASAASLSSEDVTLREDVALRDAVRGFLQARRLREAEAYCQAILRQAPDNREANIWLGVALARQRRFMEAVQPLVRAVELESGNAMARALLARIYARLKQPAEAVKQLQAMGTTARRDFRLQYLEARCHLASGDARLCAFAINRAIALNPGSEVAYVYQGFGLSGTGRWRNSVDAFRRAEALLKIWPEAAAVYADALLNFKRYPEAEEWYTVALRSAPGDVRYVLGKVEALIYMRATEAVVDLLEGLREKGEASARFLYLSGIARHELLHGASGKDELLAAAELYETQSEDLTPQAARKLYLTLGEIALQGGHYEDACQWLGKAREAVPRDQHILLLLALAHFRLDDLDVAAELARTAIELTAGAPEADPYMLLGLSLFGKGDLDEAKKALKQATDISPLSGDAYGVLARIYIAHEEWDEAEIALARVRKLNPGMPDWGEMVAEVSTALGRPFNEEADVAVLLPDDLPDIFRPPPMGNIAPPPLLRALPVHLRVVKALMVREMLTRFGRSRIGYLWAILQPIMLILTLYFVFKFANRRLPAGVSLETFLLTGVVPLYLFIQTKARLSRAIKSNRTLFYFRQVSPLSVLVSSAFLEFATYVSVFFIVLGLINFFGETVYIYSYVELILCFVAIGLMGFGAGAIFGVLMPRFEVLEHASMVINRIVFFTSGMFFYGNELPERLRDVLLINPLFHVIEFLRGAFYASYTPHFASVTYVGLWVAALLLGGLVLERVGRRLAV